MTTAGTPRGGRPLLERRVVTGLVRAPAAPRPSARPGVPGAAGTGAADHGATDAVTEDLTRHLPGELVTRELVRRHEALPALGRLARLAGRSPLTYATAAAYAQAVGERRVGALLARLGPRWHVLHALPVDVPGRHPADVDHLLIGPAGVWVVETTHRPAQHVRVEGHRGRADSQPLGQVRAVDALAVTVSGLLSAALGDDVTVRAVVAVVGARSVRADSLPRGVLVVDAEDLPTLFGRRAAVMSSVLVDRIARAAADPRTWSATASLPGTSGRHDGSTDPLADRPTDGPAVETTQDRDARRRRDALLLDRIDAHVKAGWRLRRGRQVLTVAGAVALVVADRVAAAAPTVGTVVAALS